MRSFIVVFLLAGMLITAASTAAQAQSGGVISACVHQHVRIVAATEACRGPETRVQWNVVGPPGPAGPAGPPGPPGTVVVEDDGTSPDAINGTWAGTLKSLSLGQVAPPFFRIFGGVPATLSDEFRIPILGPGTCTGMAGSVSCLTQTGDKVVALNVPPGQPLATASAEAVPITLTVTREGRSLTGSVATADGPAATMTGAAVTNRFFLFRVATTGDPGPCAPGRFQGSASLSPVNPDSLTFTGSGIDSNCSHSIFSINFLRQPTP